MMTDHRPGQEPDAAELLGLGTVDGKELQNRWYSAAVGDGRQQVLGLLTMTFVTEPGRPFLQERLPVAVGLFLLALVALVVSGLLAARPSSVPLDVAQVLPARIPVGIEVDGQREVGGLLGPQSIAIAPQAQLDVCLRQIVSCSRAGPRRRPA